MRTLQELTSWIDCAVFFAWSAAVWGLGKGMFRSWFGERYLDLLDLLFGDASRQLRQMTWSIRHGREWHVEAAGKNRPDLARGLTSEEVAQLVDGRRRVWWKGQVDRFMRYPMGCEFCQAFWAAIVLLLISSESSGFLAATVPAALAYAVVATFVVGRLTTPKGK